MLIFPAIPFFVDGIADICIGSLLPHHPSECSLLWILIFENMILFIKLLSLEKTPIPLLESIILIFLKIILFIGFSPYPTLIPEDLEVILQLLKIIFFASLD